MLSLDIELAEAREWHSVVGREVHELPADGGAEFVCDSHMAHRQRVELRDALRQEREKPCLRDVGAVDQEGAEIRPEIFSLAETRGHVDDAHAVV